MLHIFYDKIIRYFFRRYFLLSAKAEFVNLVDSTDRNLDSRIDVVSLNTCMAGI